MALEDVLNATGKHQVFKGEDISQAIDYTKTYNLVRSYLDSTGRGESMPARPTPEYIGAVAKEIRKETESNLVKTVSENYQEIISNLGEKELKDLASLYGLPKELRAIKEALDNGDIKTLKEAYITEISKEAILMAGAKYLDQTDIAEIMERKYRIKESNLFDKNLSTEKEEGKYEFDMEKAQKYISETISKIDEKKKNESYLILGYVYSKKKAKEEAEKAKKEKK